MGKALLFHGGELEKETFGGCTFWHHNAHIASEYGEELWCIFIDYATETLADESDYIDYSDLSPSTADEAWQAQTMAVLKSISDGATVIQCEDGECVVNATRLNPKKVGFETASKMEDIFFGTEWLGSLNELVDLANKELEL